MNLLKKLFLFQFIFAAAIVNPYAQQPSVNGYYKDVFMDSGIMLTSRKDLPATRYLGLSIDAFVSAVHTPISKLTLRDTLLQRECICGTDVDLNGILLYPDGQPRYRMIYMNGGKATSHGKSLTETGRSRIQQFIANGGSYVGTCAGAYIASNGTHKDTTLPHAGYMGIWPGLTHATGLSNNYTGMFVEKRSPLLRYYDFGGDMHIDSVRHNGGCYADYKCPVPEGTEILLRYDYDTVSAKSKVKIHNEVSAWSYKRDDMSGRVVSIGSHPEGVSSGERLDLMSAMILYAIDGNGAVKTKGTLVPNVAREMNKKTTDNDPSFTRIGDRQYHHFMVEVPKNVSKMVINLKGYEGENNFDLSLLANDKSLAFHNSPWQEVSLGCDKTLIVKRPKAGTWHVSVFCETTVDSNFGEYGTEYFGRTDVLNGVPYNIEVKFE